MALNFLFQLGSFVHNPDKPNWGIGQVQSMDRHRVTVNFENKGKLLINTNIVNLELIYGIEEYQNTRKDI